MVDGDDRHARLRRLPAVSALLERPELLPFLRQRGHAAVVEAIQSVLAEGRRGILEDQPGPTGADDFIHQAVARLRLPSTPFRRVVNATGVLLHTGLGRAPLDDAVLGLVRHTAAGSCDLEIDLETGKRGPRGTAVVHLLRRLTGAEAALVVNNNAAATVLALRALAAGREVVVSRGQLVEIGGSYRLPEIFAVSGARLREVGTTNKTRLADYVAAFGPETGAILRVHTSNYRIVGFTEEAPLAGLVELARERGIPLIDDIGSGALAPGLPRGISPSEPTFRGSIDAGADLVLASGDKLLGGPQCGIAVGRVELIERMRKDPLARALRVDKLRLAALAATLRFASEPDLAHERILLWRLLATPLDVLQARGQALAHALRDFGWIVTVEPATAEVGGGSLPGEAIPSVALRLDPPYPGCHGGPDVLARALRMGEHPVVGRIRDDALWLDLRSVPEADIDRLRQAIESLTPPADSANDHPPSGQESS